jgi:hypothetical protein
MSGALNLDPDHGFFHCSFKEMRIREKIPGENWAQFTVETRQVVIDIFSKN